ncbi:PREDICTED: uncharacterized protein LOC104601388 isoform X2 [Nelumbo nucifera]|uniref:Uncharacterized protein LOC104601388 isoform X2 n=1 Tax=Nelumbo nucifera TaxID=4432 RepID=A0A1U8A8M4_NELNU|nr:PREDICTED: uncharacterized protein LOC104601388 isoform X2 [Nelumbo nucifera]
MGSLTAGWGSLVPDAKFLRNKSFTKGEIDAYWRSKKRIEEEHLKSISGLHDHSQESANTGGGLQRSNSEADVEALKKKMDWWTRCGSAFLNQPPVIAPTNMRHAFA